MNNKEAPSLHSPAVIANNLVEAHFGLGEVDVISRVKKDAESLLKMNQTVQFVDEALDHILSDPAAVHRVRQRIVAQWHARHQLNVPIRSMSDLYRGNLD